MCVCEAIAALLAYNSASPNRRHNIDTGRKTDRETEGKRDSCDRQEQAYDHQMKYAERIELRPDTNVAWRLIFLYEEN